MLGGREAFPGVFCPPKGVDWVRCLGCVGGEKSVADEVVIDVVRCVRGVVCDIASSGSLAGDRCCFRVTNGCRGAEIDDARFEMLFWRDGVVVDLLKDELMLDVDRAGSRKDVGGGGFEILRGAFAALNLLARLGGWASDGVIGVTLGERDAESIVFGEPFVLLRSGTMVVTPLTLLASDADE